MNLAHNPKKFYTTKLFVLTLLFSVIPVSLEAQAVNSQQQELTPSGLSVSDLLPTQTEQAEEKTEINTRYFAVTFSSKGAKIISFRHKDSINKLRNLTQIAEPDPFWFNMYLNQNSFTNLEKTHFTITTQEGTDRLTVIATTSVSLVTPEGKFPGRIEKKFVFFKDTHYYQFSWSVTNLSQEKIGVPSLNLLPITRIGPTADSLSPRAKNSYQNFYHAGSKFKSYSITSGHSSSFLSCGGNKNTVEEIIQPVNFMGMSSRFMVMSVQPLANVSTDKLIIFPPSGETLPAEQQLQISKFVIEKGQTKNFDFLIYTGPKINDYVNVYKLPETLKKYPELKQVHESITEAFNFGITAPIRDAIVFILKQLYKIYPNYGVGIILFALFFRLLFYPINEKQSQSIEKMKKLQPLLKEINEKYKDDPQEKQKRTMALYQQHKVNPLGGCLPMLIQLPIFIALYSAFSDSYELWKSPFIHGWISDLSEPDTLFIVPNFIPFLKGFHFHALPIIMAASQILQSRMTAVSEDPNQKMIMQFMPLIMLFIFWRMPSGVVLYWTIFNTLMIVQQLITKMRNKEEAKA